MVKTLAELRNATDNELLTCVAEAKGHTGNDFQSTFGTDYSYSCITSELSSRGYVNGWYLPTNNKVTKEIRVKFGEENARMNLNMTAECKKRFEKFLENKSYNFIHTTAALMNYLDEVENKEIKVSVEVL